MEYTRGGQQGFTVVVTFFAVNKAIEIIITCMSVSIWTVTLLLPTPIFDNKSTKRGMEVKLYFSKKMMPNSNSNQEKKHTKIFSSKADITYTFVLLSTLGLFKWLKIV